MGGSIWYLSLTSHADLAALEEKVFYCVVMSVDI